MKEQVELRVRQTQISEAATLVDLMVADVVANQNFIVTGAPNIFSAYPIGSKVEIFNLSLVVVFTGYVSGVDSVNGFVYFNQQFSLNLLATDVSAVNVYANEGDEESVDLYENESISQNWQFTDLDSFQPLGTFTREFRVPYSKQNAEILGLFYDVNFTDVGNVFDTKLPAKILVDKIVISTGVLRIINIVLNKNGWHDLQVAFYGQTPQLFLDIKDKRLNQINGLSNLNHIVNPFSILAFNLIMDQRCYALIERGVRFAENNLGSSIGVEYNDTSSGDRKLNSSLTLCVSWKYLFESIIVGAGYELEADNLLNILNDYWCPWLGKTGKVVNPDKYLFRQILSTQTIPGFTTYLMTSGTTYYAADMVPVSGPPPSPQYITLLDNSSSCGDGIFTCPITADYKIAVWASYIMIGNLDQMFAVIKWTKAATGAVVTLNPWSDTLVGSGPVTRSTYGISSYNGGYINAEEGDTFEIAFRYNDGGSTGTGYELQAVSSNDYYTLGSGWECVEVRPRSTEYYRDMTWDAPDILQTDLVSDVLKMHNCIIVQDNLNPRKIKIEPLTTYLGSGGTDDWSTKLDTSKDIIIKSASEYQKKKLEFTYSAGQDTNSKIYTTAGRTYGSYKIDGYPIDNIGSVSQFVSGELKVSLVTQSTPTSLLGSWITTTGFTTVPAPHFVDDAFNYVPPGLRCLRVAAMQDITFGLLPSGNLPAQAPLLSHYSSLAPSITDYDLNWAPEKPLISVPAQPYNNLFNLYWREYLDQIYSGRSRIMEAHFALTINDILDFSFDKYFWIKDSYWRVLEIKDYKHGQDESTAVVLIKVVNDASQCTLTPTESNSDGSIVWQDSEGNESDGNAVCCNLLGWFWSPTQQKCFANVSNEPSGVSEARNIIAGGSLNSSNSSIPNASIGVGRDINTGGFQSNLLLQGDALNIVGEVTYSQVTGRQNTIEVDKSVRGVSLSGINGKTSLPGKHFSGGVRDNTTVQGAMQTGEILFYNAKVFNYSGDFQKLFLDNGVPFVFPEDTTWFILIESLASNASSAFWLTSEYSGVLINKGGTLLVELIQGKYYDSSPPNSFKLVPNITVASGAFEVSLQVIDMAGYLFPTPPVQLTCRIKYIQTR